MKIIEQHAALKGRWQCIHCGTIVEFEPDDLRAYPDLLFFNKPKWPTTRIVCPVENEPRDFWLVSNV